jgi:hypothetical protein
VRAAVEAAEVLARLGGVARLAEDLAVERDDRVGAEDERTGDRGRLQAGIGLRDRGRLARGRLFDVRGPRLERDPRLGEDRPPLRRGGGEN